MFARLCLFAACAVAVATVPALAKEKDKSAVAPEQVQCTGIFAQDSSEALLIETFGAENVVTGPVPGPEGTEVIATTVFPDDAARRMEFNWWDEAYTSLSYVELNANQTAPGGVRIGMSVADVVALNGEPIIVGGFGWDYGGYANIESGALAGANQGCYLSIRFAPNADYSGTEDTLAVSGEVQVPSDEPLLETLDVRVQTLGISYPDPDFVEESAL